MMTRVLGAAVKGVILAVAGLSLSGCVNLTACSAVGYIYAGPAVVEFALPLPDAALVAACFGTGCTPEVVDRADGQRWEVPQDVPYMRADALGGGAERILRVTVSDSRDIIFSDDEYEIPISMEKTGVFGQCPGPFSFEPVSVPFPG